MLTLKKKQRHRIEAFKRVRPFDQAYMPLRSDHLAQLSGTLIRAGQHNDDIDDRKTEMRKLRRERPIVVYHMVGAESTAPGFRLWS